MPKRQTLIVDASYDDNTGRTGIGIAVHETDKPRRNGTLIDQVAECYTGIPPGHGEMLAVYRALELGAERGFTVVKIRSDYNHMRQSLKKSYERGSRIDGNLKGGIMRLARRYESVHFGYTPRRKNQMAHSLARAAVKEKTPMHRADLIDLCSDGEPQGEYAATQNGESPAALTRLWANRSAVGQRG